MADIALSQLKGADTKRPFSLSNGGTIPTGTTADFVISCPVGKYIRITHLYSSDTFESGVTLNCGGRDLFTGLLVGRGRVTVGYLKIGLEGSGTVSDGYSQQYVQGGRNEDFTLSFATTTVRDIKYSYDVMEDDA